MWTEFILLYGPIVVNDIKCLQWLDEKWMLNASFMSFLCLDVAVVALRIIFDSESSTTQIHSYSFVSYTIDDAASTNVIYYLLHDDNEILVRCRTAFKVSATNAIIYSINDNLCLTLHSINRFICLILSTERPFQEMISLNNAAQIMYCISQPHMFGTQALQKSWEKICC